GKHGWHPHLHVLIFTGALDDDARGEFAADLFERWSARIDKLGLGTCSPKAFEFHRCHKVESAGDYVAKWGCDSEIAKAGTKVARGENRTPWGLLAAHGEGDREAGE